MKALIAADILCAHPDPFHIFTDASDYQLGMCIIQKANRLHIIVRSLILNKFNNATIDKVFFVL